MTLDELTQGFIEELTDPDINDETRKKVVEVWQKRFEEAGYGPLEWNGRSWLMYGRTRIVTETPDAS